MNKTKEDNKFAWLATIASAAVLYCAGAIAWQLRRRLTIMEDNIKRLQKEVEAKESQTQQYRVRNQELVQKQREMLNVFGPFRRWILNAKHQQILRKLTSIAGDLIIIPTDMAHRRSSWRLFARYFFSNIMPKCRLCNEIFDFEQHQSASGLPISCTDCPFTICKQCLMQLVSGQPLIVQCPQCRVPAGFDTFEPRINHAFCNLARDYENKLVESLLSLDNGNLAM